MSTGRTPSTWATTCLVLVFTSAALAQSAPPGVPDELRRLASMKTLCVESFTGDAALASTVREMVFAGLFTGRVFTLRERCEPSDVVMKGAVVERETSKVRAEGEATEFGAAGGAAVRDGATAAAAISALAGGQSESLYSAETGRTAAVVLRIVDGDGVVLWAHSQESPGGKLRGAAGDAVDRAIKQLLRDLSRARAAP